MSADVAGLFVPGPGQWGLRGDPYLWAEMKGHFEGVPLPDSEEVLRAQLAAAFELLAGQPVTNTAHFFVQRFARGGMSSGLVSPSFWRERGIPLLCERFRAGRA